MMNIKDALIYENIEELRRAQSKNDSKAKKLKFLSRHLIQRNLPYNSTTTVFKIRNVCRVLHCRVQVEEDSLNKRDAVCSIDFLLLDKCSNFCKSYMDTLYICESWLRWCYS